ncbi:hypothetical protein [Pedobacter aquatilis]|uniref:hypothetical protein n=1 Tax=Pedobacter aquatilis TaxID=351343 RepID=UPI00292EBF00|nr:hypothetical protein [Pedobacter aquatilis]
MDYAKKAIAQIHTLAYSLEEYHKNYSCGVELTKDAKGEYCFNILLYEELGGNISISPKEVASVLEIKEFITNGVILHLAIHKIWDNLKVPFTGTVADSLFILEIPFKMESQIMNK